MEREQEINELVETADFLIRTILSADSKKEAMRTSVKNMKNAFKSLLTESEIAANNLFIESDKSDTATLLDLYEDGSITYSDILTSALGAMYNLKWKIQQAAQTTEVLKEIADIADTILDDKSLGINYAIIIQQLDDQDYSISDTLSLVENVIKGIKKLAFLSVELSRVATIADAMDEEIEMIGELANQMKSPLKPLRMIKKHAIDFSVACWPKKDKFGLSCSNSSGPIETTLPDFMKTLANSLDTLTESLEYAAECVQETWSAASSLSFEKEYLEILRNRLESKIEMFDT